MIEHLLANDTSRKFLVTLHPKDKYNAEEKEAIFALEEKHKRLTVCNHNTSSLLQRCDYVATQNSAVAQSGFFFHRTGCFVQAL